MAKLHEALAVERSLKTQATKCLHDLRNTFEKKLTHFSEKIITFRSATAGVDPVQESHLKITTGVGDELEWLQGHISKAFDISFRIAKANTEAKADIIIEGMPAPLATNVPATALLELEKRMVELKVLVDAIPTLDPSKNFEPDTAKGGGIFKAREVVKNRTVKEQRPLVLYEATDKHPAQVQMVTQDIVTGTILEQEWSSLITVAEKAKMLDRLENLTRAIAAARSRANECPVPDGAIGNTLLAYVFGTT